MRKISNWLCLMTASLFLLGNGLANAYDYPFADPYVATVVNTPREYAEVLPAKIPLKVETVKMFPEREVPGILWNLGALRYSYSRQDGPAPLIFLVAGTRGQFQQRQDAGDAKGLLPRWLSCDLAVVFDSS